MNQSESFLQIIVTYPDGSAAVVPLMGNRVNIGSRPGSQLYLEGEEVLPNHARVLVTSSSNVLYIDLSAAPSVPVKWEVGQAVMIGGHQLHLAQGIDQPLEAELMAGLLDEVLPEVPVSPDHLPEIPPQRARLSRTPLPDEIFERANGLLETMSERGRRVMEKGEPSVNHTLPPAPPGLPESEFDQVEMAASSEADVNTYRGHEHPGVEDEKTTQRLTRARKTESLAEVPAVRLAEAAEVLAQQQPLQELPRLEDDADEALADTQNWQLPLTSEDEDQITQPYVPAHGALPLIEALIDEYTQPKDYHYHSNFSAQLTINPVNVVPGERVRVPISIHNGNAFNAEVRVLVAGLPSGWECAPVSRLPLRPGEVRGVDLVLQTRPGFQQTAAELLVLVSDVLSPNIAIQLPLVVALKREANLTGRLEASLVRDKDTAYLNLQNHTLAETQVFISGEVQGGEADLLLPEYAFQLAPGQSIRVPARFRTHRRPLLREQRHEFWLSAQQGSRAPLDYTGVVRVMPRLGWLPLLILLLIVAEVIIAAVVVLNSLN